MTAKIRSLLPAKVYILGVEYPVSIYSEGSLGGGKWAEFDPKSRTIKIEDIPELDAQTIWGLLIHEILHGLLYHSGLDQLLSNDLQEALCAVSENIARSGIILSRKPLKE